MADEQQGERWIEIHRPIVGLVTQGSVDQVPIEAASEINGYVFDDFTLTKDTGCDQIGTVTDAPSSPPGPDTGCLWGAQCGTAAAPDNSPPNTGGGNGRPLLKQYQVINQYLYELDDSDPDPDLWEWIGAVSRAVPATAADIIGNALEFGTHVQDGHRVYYADGGPIRRFYDLWLHQMFDWGSDLTQLAAGAITGETATGGEKLGDRGYSMKYTYESSVTGQESNASDESNVFTTTAGADTRILNGTIPANAEWDSAWDIVNLFSSPGALSPSVPEEWKFEKQMTGVTGLDTTPLAFTLEALDGNLGRLAPDDNGPVPPGKYIVRDPQGEEVLMFGDPTAPNRFYWPKSGFIGSFPPENADDVDDDETDFIAGGFNMLGRFYLLKRRRGIWMLNGNGDGGYEKAWLTSDAGCRSHWSIVVVGTRAFWASSVGFIEFSGQSPRIISSAIRDLVKRLARHALFDRCHGVYDRRVDKNSIRWFCYDPDTGANIELIYDLTIQSWTTRTRGDNVTLEAGDSMLTPWQSESPDGSFDVMCGDGSGRVFQLHRDVNSDDVWSDNGYPYTADFWTVWLGNGIDSVAPIEVEFEMERAPLEADGGYYQILLQRDGESAEEVEPKVPLWSTGDTDPILAAKKYHAAKVLFKRGPGTCRRYRVGIRHTGAGGRPKVHWLRIKEVFEGDRLRPMPYGGGAPPD